MATDILRWQQGSTISAWHGLTLANIKKAIEYLEQALSILKEVYRKKHPYVPITLTNIGIAWYALGDSRRSKEYFQQAYSIFRES